MKLLIVVDYQYDFVAEDGKLTAGAPALAVESRIAEKIKALREEEGELIFTLDAHSEPDWQEQKHPEGQIFPSHCIKGTPGYELFGAVKPLSEGAMLVDKRAYCPDLSSPAIVDKIRRCSEIEVCGVVTDICVFQTVIGLYTYIINHQLPISLTVDKKACASFHPEREALTLQYMKEVLGVHVIA